MPLNPRLDDLSDYPFAQLRALLADITPRLNEAPIAMSLGEPQHQPPPLLAETVAAHADQWNLYPPMAGTPELRAAAADWLTRRYALPAGMLSPERHVLSLSGTKEGLYLAAMLAVPQHKAGARPIVLAPNPYYLVYNGAATMAGAETVFLDAVRDNGFLPDLDAIPAETLARTALCYLCSPANPQGTVASLAYLQKAIALARRYDFVLAIDECYAEIYDRASPPGGLEACVALGGGLANVLVFHSLSKRSSAPGLRAGFVAGDPVLIDRFLHLRNYGGCQLPLPIQAAAAALWRDESHAIENRARYRRKFDLAEAALGGRCNFYRPEGGFYLWLDVGDGEQAAVALWREAAIRVLPGGYIARAANGAANPGQSYIRLALVHDEPVLETAFTRIRRVL
ncbi:MAG TPA: aminotransferase class I/II-fold pyridoxal phosphate-dependent enzyme [Stellaceae bacterium]|nr:aminotransferase class I/II-fold pyridoxal phosphate-dependent enzyme [Stellaceae bacterium]